MKYIMFPCEHDCNGGVAILKYVYAFSDTPHSKRQDVEIWMATDSDDIVPPDIPVNVMLELDTFLSRRRNVTPSIEELTPPGDYNGKHKLHKYE